MYMLVSLFGYVSAFRILKSFEEKKYFNNLLLTKIGTATVFILTMSIFLFSNSVFMMVLVTGTELFALMYFPLLTVLLGEMKLRRELPETLRMMVLHLNLGKSFRGAFHEVLKHQPSSLVQKQMQKMFKIVTFPQQKQSVFYLSELNNLVKDLQFADNLESGVINCIKYLQEHQKMVSDFRRKSGKIKSQIQLQAFLLTVIFIAVSGFMVSVYGFHQTSYFLIWATILVLIGHIFSVYMGRKIKWRI